MDLKKVFEPKTMAVVGVSVTNPLNPGTVIFNKNHHEMQVKTIPVNLRGGSIEGKQIYPTVLDIPEEVDLAVIVVRADIVNSVLEDCGKAGIGGAIVISGGFAEMGNSGVELQKELVKIASEYDIALIGPNCMGVYSPPYVDTFFIPSERMLKPPPGNVAILSQSGGFIVDQFLSKYAERKIGVSAAVSIGNKAVVDETILMEYFLKDKRTKTVAMYLEGFRPGEGRRFLDVAAEFGGGKNIIVFRAGKTAGGQKAAMSHTSSIAASPRLASHIFRQYGIVEAENEQEIVSFAKVLSFKNKPIKNGDIAILTVSGGHGVVCADLVAKYGLNLVEFTQEEMREMKQLISPAAARIASLSNPIDLTGSAEDVDMERVLEYLLQIDRVEAVIILTFPYPPTISMQIGRRLSNIAGRYGKPVVAYVPWLLKYDIIIEGFEINNVPVAHTVEEAVQMIKALKMRRPMEQQ
ncbi:MAG: CoA-binding protein [Candidatus Freyarchaeota archaeon]|nr:CoA-binding protein [Candidatus Jordarchaeia archaeon]MBS7280093.1 CoA-binding protein [Candidatus Jordarchaeia archaeon]